ncbi:MAG: hypothetical protein LUM44_04160 [Pyrinomonadaceae bacterium]|nr:hypothetical protein [Pyrinomonadaceae bacterium]
MKKIVVGAVLILLIFSADSFSQKSQKLRKIREMITDSQKNNSLFSGLLGADVSTDSSVETTMLSAITFPNKIKVKYLDENHKLSKNRKKLVDKWLAEYGEKGSEKKFYLNEIAVEEEGTRYWIISHEKNVIEKLKNSVKKDDEMILQMRLLGYHKKGQTIDYLLMAEDLE